ncbi:hypothetical protein DOY81_011711 [Sarcophaga bullata]|nr:hypothetical protein DOY81_011711 [Sarcophaga bullata]
MDALQILVQILLYGFIELREDTVETLLVRACLLQLNAVVTACCNFFGKATASLPTVWVLLSFAEQQSCNALLRVAKAYTCQHFSRFVKNQEFFQ